MIQLIAIGVLALGVVTFVAGGLHKYNSAIEKAQQAEAKLATCKTDYATLDGRVGQQNVALDALRGERNEAQRKMEAALAAAGKAQADRAGERARAENLERNFKAVGPCPADQAVEEVRKGLKP
jgi:chromosome segregation ATPase